MNKIVLGQKSWTKTAAMILEEINTRFPNIKNYYQIGPGRLSALLHHKKAYQIGFVFMLTGKQDKSNTECIIYYPIKDTFVHRFCPLPHSPLNERDEVYQTKQGLMRIVDIEGEPAVAFETEYSRVV